MNPLSVDTQETIWTSIPRNDWQWGDAILEASGIHVSRIQPSSAGGVMLLAIRERVEADGEAKWVSKDSLTASIRSGAIRELADFDRLRALLLRDNLIEVGAEGGVRLTRRGKVVAEFLERCDRLVRAQQPYAMFAGA